MWIWRSVMILRSSESCSLRWQFSWTSVAQVVKLVEERMVVGPETNKLGAEVVEVPLLAHPPTPCSKSFSSVWIMVCMLSELRVRGFYRRRKKSTWYSLPNYLSVNIIIRCLCTTLFSKGNNTQCIRFHYTINIYIYKLDFMWMRLVNSLVRIYRLEHGACSSH